MGEIAYFLASQPWLKALSPETMMQLKGTFKLFVILKDAVCSFSTQCSSTKGSNDLHQRMSFLDSNENSGIYSSYFSLEIVLGTSQGRDKDKSVISPNYPPSLFFRINQQFYLVNHTIIDELSFPKEPSSSSTSTSKKNNTNMFKMPLASMKIGHLLIQITFPVPVSTSISNNTTKHADNMDTNNEVCERKWEMKSKITRAEAVLRLASVAKQMNETLQFSLLVNHPLITSDASYNVLFNDQFSATSANHGSSSSSSSSSSSESSESSESNDATKDDESLVDINVDDNSNSTVGHKELKSQDDHSNQPSTNNSLGDNNNCREKDVNLTETTTTTKTSRKRSFGEHNCNNVQEDMITVKEAANVISQKLMAWVESLDEFDFLLQPVLRNDQMATCLLQNNDTGHHRNTDNQHQLMLGSRGVFSEMDDTSCDGASAGGDVESGEPNVAVVLKQLSQSMLSKTKQTEMHRVLSADMEGIEREVYALLGTIFDGQSISLPGHIVDDDSNNERRNLPSLPCNGTTSHDKVDRFVQGRKRARYDDTTSASSPSQEGIVASEHVRDNDEIDDEVDDDVSNSQKNNIGESVGSVEFTIDGDGGEDEDEDGGEQRSSQGTESEHSYHFPPPIPLSQYSHQEKREFFDKIDVLIDTRLSVASQHCTALISVLPIRNDFTRSSSTIRNPIH